MYTLDVKGKLNKPALDLTQLNGDQAVLLQRAITTQIGG